MEDSPVIKLAAFIIIIAAMIFAKSIINPFCLRFHKYHLCTADLLA